MTDDRGFLAALLADPGDTETRMVYADWLEEQGDPRGEFLRLELRLAGHPRESPEHEQLLVRLRKLREGIDLAWLASLDQTAVENCGVDFRFMCPAQWEQLQPTEDRTVRFCATCARNVHYCGTINQARHHAEQGHCVAVDSRVARCEGDLPAPESSLFEDSVTLGVPAFPDGWEADWPTDPEIDLAPPEEPPPPPPKKKWWQFWKRSQ